LYAVKVVPASAAAAPMDIPLPPETPAKPVTVSPPAAPPAEDESSAALRNALESIVKDNTSGASIAVGTSSRGLVLSLAEAGSFPPGRADLSRAAIDVMLTVSDALRKVPNLIRVEGHTDDRPIRYSRLFASNWELSAARATRVVRLMTRDGGLDPGRLSAAGYAEFRPLVPNKSNNARARNRRVDIVILDEAAATVEEPVALQQ